MIDEEVYDHVQFRSRGRFGRFAYGKNHFKFRFNRGQLARLPRDGRRKRAVPGRALRHINLDSLMLNLMSGYRREYEPVGTHGIPQSLSSRYYELFDGKFFLHFFVFFYF